MRTILPLAVAVLLAGFPALAQDAATKDALSGDKAVQDSQQPNPTPQGTRSPEASTSGATQHPDLQQALAAVRRAPPDLQGNPVPRPNWLASEPDQPDEPSRSRDPSDLSSQEVK
ncbi:hypothetical protein [Azospirillum thermophilum]|uniref:Uncharacterized protein n=1 Tax=Azospirillum thermophilum TaxID=2202148 RepID=A0A2S2CK55_9PROT|nr:hypothetical protein [Azospirillum thermophilum]AWK84888.1 hypothetical protein DEW08_00600 [Azospirillum thermophilum]